MKSKKKGGKTQIVLPHSTIPQRLTNENKMHLTENILQIEKIHIYPL